MLKAQGENIPGKILWLQHQFDYYLNGGLLPAARVCLSVCLSVGVSVCSTPCPLYLPTGTHGAARQ
jgi:hypothetical protein